MKSSSLFLTIDFGSEQWWWRWLCAVFWLIQSEWCFCGSFLSRRLLAASTLGGGNNEWITPYISYISIWPPSSEKETFMDLIQLISIYQSGWCLFQHCSFCTNKFIFVPALQEGNLYHQTEPPVTYLMFSSLECAPVLCAVWQSLQLGTRSQIGPFFVSPRTPHICLAPPLTQQFFVSASFMNNNHWTFNLNSSTLPLLSAWYFFLSSYLQSLITTCFLESRTSRPTPTPRVKCQNKRTTFQDGASLRMLFSNPNIHAAKRHIFISLCIASNEHSSRAERLQSRRAKRLHSSRAERLQSRRARLSQILSWRGARACVRG